MSLKYAFDQRDYGWLEQMGGKFAAGGVLPQLAALIFKANLETTLTPQIGGAGTFARASNVTYFPSTTTLGNKTSGNPALTAYNFTGSATGGYQNQGTRKNWLLWSEEPIVLGFSGNHDPTWTIVNTLNIDQASGLAPDGVTAAIELRSNDNASGVQQSSTIAAASHSVVASIFARGTFGGNSACTLTVEGDSGGTPETTSTLFTTSGSNWRRFNVFKTFSAGATGNVRFKFTIDGGGSPVDIWGCMLELAEDSGFTGQAVKTPSPYIKTTTVVTSTNSDDLFYPSATFTTAITTGSLSFWVNSLWIQSDMLNASGAVKYFFAMSTTDAALNMQINSSGNLDAYFGSGGRVHTVANTWTTGIWRNYIWTWDNSTGTINSQLYRDGAQIATNTTLVTTTPTLGNVAIGSRLNFAFKESFIDAIIRNWRWWNVKLNATEVAQVFGLERGAFGV